MLKRTPHTVLSKPAIVRGVRVPRATIDFEGRSAGDIKKIGGWLYSRHETTEPHCLAYHIPGQDRNQPKLWHRAYEAIDLPETELPEDLWDWIAKGGMVEAHNAGFEMAFWENQMAAKYFWPEVPADQWLCSAAKASALALPRALEDLCEALELDVVKDKEAGKQFITTYCKPKRLTKAEKELYGANAVVFNEDVIGLRKGFEYCRQDVRSEMAASDACIDLSPDEEKLWRVTMAMNRRGTTIDVELAKAALILAAKAKAEYNERLEAITKNTPLGNDDEGLRGGQREALKAWLLINEDLELADTKAKTLEWYVERAALSPRAKEVLTIVREVNRTSTNKYKRMLERVDTDNKARELMVYCGAERTGRFSSSGIQIHNLPKGRWTLPLSKEDTKANIAMDLAVEDVKSKDLAWCKAIHGDVMNLVASCLRGSIIASPGRDLMTADYSAIEARVVLWLAEAQGALQVFRDGKDIYCDMASGIYGREITKETAKPINAMGATERDFGKVAILGLGYNMGWLKFIISMRSYNIYLTREEVEEAMGGPKLHKYEKIVTRLLYPKMTDFSGKNAIKRFRSAEREASKNRRALLEEREDPRAIMHELALCKYTVETYRKRYPEVPAMWKAQEEAAIKAIATGKGVRCGKVVWKVVGRFLKCRLPGGRCLNYATPKLAHAKTSWGETKPSIRFMGRDQKTGRWSRQATYGGKITENITQATARDIMGHAKNQLADDPIYDLLLSVHDEIIAEVDSDKGDGDLFAKTMATLPPEYEGCPINAEPKRYRRYRK